MPLSNKEKMLAGELYFANDPELLGERRAAQRLLARYNMTDPDDQPGRMGLLRQLFGAVGDGVDILPRFHCDYGYSIRVGRNCFINYNCVFLDCAPIEIGDGAVIGAGSVVTRDVPPETLVLGNPARIVRSLA